MWGGAKGGILVWGGGRGGARGGIFVWCGAGGGARGDTCVV